MSPNINPYPAEMRNNLWPLCCGAAIISGFKDASEKTAEQLAVDLDRVMAETPYNQVYQGEQIKPVNQFIITNQSQSASTKITNVLKSAGFKAVFTTNGYANSPDALTYWVKSESFKLVA